MISVIENRYIVQLPELGIYQDIDPATGDAFADEAAANAWADARQAAARALRDAEADAERERMAKTLRIDVVADKPRAMLGETIIIKAVVKNGLDEVVPVNDAFAVPVTDETGRVALIKLATFAAGRASVAFTPSRSGYYCVTETAINHKLPDGVHFGLPQPLEITVFE